MLCKLLKSFVIQMQNHYTCQTRIGNWYEEMVLEDEKMREFLEKKAKGTLTIQKIRQNLNSVAMPPPNPDGNLHYGTPIRLVNEEFGFFLACDPGDAENVEEEMYSATASRQADVTARNVWILRRIDEITDKPVESDAGGDDVVCYGDRFLIQSTDALDAKPFYIGSHILDWAHFSRISRKQIVYSTQKESYMNTWTVESIGRDTMMEMEGEPVKIGDMVLIKHASTQAPLAATEASVLNDYGNENELIAGRIPGKNCIWRFSDH